MTVTRAQFGHWFRMATRWADLDSLGHVNNVKFFTFDESVRLDYFGDVMRGDPDFWKKHGFILARIECDFIQQLRHPAELDIGFRITRIGRSSMQTEAGHFVGDTLHAVSRGVVVWFDYANQRPHPLPDSVRGLIRAREPIPPDEAK